MKKLAYALALVGLAPLVASAEDVPAAAAPAAAPAAKPAIPSLSDVLGASNITLTGYVDATYTSFNKKENSYANNGTSNAEPLRQFDYRKNSFALNQAALTASFTPASGFGGLVNLIAGSDGRVLRNSELSGTSTSSDIDIFQGYAQYANGPLTVMAGKFATLAGAEVVNPTANTNISRSLLFTNLEPLSHTGLRAAYVVGPATLTAGVNNGWNYTSAPKDGTGTSISGKTLELGVSATPIKMLSLSGAIYTGDAPSGGPKGYGTRDLYDLVATINATDALSFVLNYDYVDQKESTPTGGKIKADGIAAYVNYTISDQWSVSLRGEYLEDKDGALTTFKGNKIKEASLDLNYSPAKNTTLRLEVRQDSSSSGDPIFDNPVTATSLTSVELEAIYKF